MLCGIFYVFRALIDMDGESIISICHHFGFKQWEILDVLHDHGIKLSERHLRRILKIINLYRRKNVSEIEDVIWKDLGNNLVTALCIYDVLWRTLDSN